MAKIEIVTAPESRAVSVATFKEYARIDSTDEDTLLGALLDSAENAAESFTWRKLMEQTWDQYFDDWADPMILSFGPVISIGTITYTDANGDSQTLSGVAEGGEWYGVPTVRRVYNKTWPTVRDHEDVIKIRYTVGYEDVGTYGDSIPDEIKQAIQAHALWHWRNREGQPMPPDHAFYRLLYPFRLMRWQTIGAP